MHDADLQGCEDLTVDLSTKVNQCTRTPFTMHCVQSWKFEQTMLSNNSIYSIW